MKIVLMIFLLISGICLKAQSKQAIRNMYFVANKSKNNFEKFSNLLHENSEEQDIVILSYQAAETMMKANFTINPFQKIAYFTQGKNSLEKLIKLKPNELELRFIRYTIQDQTPSFLGYKNNILSDKAFILMKLNDEKDLDLVNKIKQYFAKPF